MIWKTILLGFLLIAACAGRAGELRVRAPVVEVVPLTEPATEVEHCGARPENDGLAAVLAWDLRENCRTEIVAPATVTGYKVFYEWDDRVYSQVMTSRPGATVPLTVRLD